VRKLPLRCIRSTKMAARSLGALLSQRRVWASYDRLLQSWAPRAQSIACGVEITWPNNLKTCGL
jgi:hypothetical protein